MARDWVYSTSGNDTTGNGTVGTPYRTPEKCMSLVQPGDSVVGRGGTYEVSLDMAGPYTNIGSGNSSDQIIITNYATETVTWTPVNGAASLVYFKPAVSNYITMIGDSLGEFVLDGLKGSITSNDGIRPGSGSGATAGYGFLFEKLVVHDFKGSGFQNANSEVIIRNCTINDNGVAPISGPPQYHGVYCGQYRNSIIELCRIYDNAGWGVHMYTSGGQSIGNNQIRLNKIYGNGSATFGGSGIVITNAGINNKVWGNWIYKNIGKGVELWNGTGNEVSHNTIDQNGSIGIVLNNSGSSTGTKVIGNLVTRNNTDGSTSDIVINLGASSVTATYNFTSATLTDNGPSTTKSNNTSSIDITAQVEDAVNDTLGSRDYTLAMGASAIDAGDATDVGYVTTSISGVSRIQGAAIDIGGDEYSSDPPDAPLVTHSGPLACTPGVYRAGTLGLQDGDSNTLEVVIVCVDASVRLTPNANVVIS